MARETVDEEAPQGNGTRRAFIGGAAVLGVAHAFAGPLTASADNGAKPCEPEPPGIPTGAMAVTPDGRTVWTADTHAATITAHRVRGLKRGRSIDVGGAPIDIAISPDGNLALVTTGFYDRPGLAVVDLRTDEVDRLAVGPSPYGVAFAPNGRSAYVSGGGAKGTITRVDPGTGRVHPPIPVGAHPRGLSIVPHGKAALVALNGAAQIARVDLVRRFVTRTIATAPFPHQLVVSPHGTRALVSHNGLDARTVTLVELRGRKKRHRLGVGKDPAGLAFSPSGRTALVAAGSGVVTLLDGKTGRRRRTVRRDGAPRSVVVANGRALVADGRTGRLAAIRLGVS